MSLSQHYTEFEELILKEIDGQAGEQEFAALCAYLRDPEMLDYYLEFMSLCAGLLRPGELNADACGADKEDFCQSALWMALAENERTAETIYVEEANPVTPVSFAKNPTISRQKVSKFSLYTALALAAAMLLLITYVVTHPRADRTAVATITGSSGAVWLQQDRSSGENKRLYTNSTMHLLEGFAEITFDNQARLILQSPVEIAIEDYNQIHLRSGKLSASIPKTAWGFVVRTDGASVVDYGTEFGVTANRNGQTEVQVFVGSVELRSGLDPIRFDETVRLVKGQVGSVSDVGDLTFESDKAHPDSYVRRLPVKPAFGQPGKRLDLADILGNGNGFGTGSLCVGINPASGQQVTELLLTHRNHENQPYHPLPDVPCIDGVFVPLGGETPQVITSQGHLFTGCPATDGSYWVEVTNKPVTSVAGNAAGEPQDIQLARLNGIQYGTALHPAIMLHANAGITFDLDAIRATIPGARIRSFTSTCGLSDTLLNTSHTDAKADLWVLVDGQKRQTLHLAGDAQQHAAIAVNLYENDRFLTLIATDGQNTNGGDWTLFGDPALELERMD